MAASDRRRTRKKKTSSSTQVQGAAQTHSGLPYFTLDKALEAELDKSPSSLKRLPKSAKTRLAVKLRLAGASYEQIAEKLGYKNAHTVESTVHQVISKSYALDDPDEVEQIIKSDLMRIDAMQLVMWEKATRYGDEKAVDRVVKLMEERRKLLGIADQNRGGDGVHVHLNGENPQALVVGGNEKDFIGQLRELRGEKPQEIEHTNGHKDTIIDAEVLHDED